MRRHLLGGVLPEALGLGFVAIIFCGFAAAYLIAEHTCARQAVATRQSQTDALAKVLAGTLGTLADGDDSTLQTLWKYWIRPPQVRSLQWTSEQGEVRFTWPPTAAAAPGSASGVPSTGAPGEDESGLVVATAAVRTPAGEPAGALRVTTGPLPNEDYGNTLFWNWGIAAATTLLVFTIIYRRLHRQLRPVAAVQRSLESYADGIEKELLALTLSDSLGSVARGWNLLIGQLAESQERLQLSGEAQQPQDILARFESAAFRRVVDRLPFGVLCVDGEQHITYANAAAATLLGHALEGLPGTALDSAVGDPAVAQALVGTPGLSAVSRSIDHTRGGEDEETNLRFRVLPTPDQASGGETVVTIEDIGQLREDQRARDNFLYHVTHELRTPLTSIRAYAETLTKPGFDDEQTRKECYNVIISETRRLASLIDNILSISQLEVGTARLEIGEVDLVRLMRQMVQDNLGAADEKHIDLTLALPPKVPRIKGDKQRLSVLLTNLIGNAIKYTPENGSVQVSLEASEQQVTISVRDTGIGIGPEDQPHVFDKFYRSAHENVQQVAGTGLGLALAREVARLHGGELHLESELGQGSTFTVDLPLLAHNHPEVNLR